MMKQVIALIPNTSKDSDGRSLIYDAVLNGKILDYGYRCDIREKYKQQYLFRMYPGWDAYQEDRKHKKI